MFVAFFYLLRQRGLDVSLNEWMTLLEGLEKGLHGASLTGFYRLCRAIVVKSEVEFDRFDQVFLEFFKDIPFKGELPEELLKWLSRPSEDLARTMKELKISGFTDEDLEDLLKMLEERLQEQKEEHNGGSYWIGTQGRSAFGNGGWHPNGIRIGGTGRNRTAMSVAGERRFRDFREDNTLDIRQFQLAFRRLRQLSGQSGTLERELDVDGTIQETCSNGGTLDLQYRPPRRNTAKLLLLMDSGGSMEEHASLCSMLFQAAVRANHFKELHTYYFHNCVYETLFTHPSLGRRNEIPTDWVMNNFNGEYRVILVGDAMMNQAELWERRYNWRTRTFAEKSGLEWLLQMIRQYPHLVWLNPEPRPRELNFWTETYLYLAELLPMYHLSVEGLESAIKRLLVRR